MPRRIRSALFIDFENMPLGKDKIESWLAWLEDGVFDAGRKRQLVVKRVFWNSSARKHEAAYKAAGFDVVCCERYHGLVNSVDVQMAIDIIESTRLRIRIDEYILVTRDSDFVPVLKRLREKGKRTAFLVDESKPNIHTTYSHHADVLISVRELNEARHYRRALKPAARAGRASAQLQMFPEIGDASTLERPALPAPRASAQNAAPVQPKRAGARPRVQPAAAAKKVEKADQADQADQAETIAQASAAVYRVMSKKKGRHTARKTIMKALAGVAGFKNTGAHAFLGHGSYKALMLALAGLEPRIEVVVHNDGGVAVSAAPVPTGHGPTGPVLLHPAELDDEMTIPF